MENHLAENSQSILKRLTIEEVKKALPSNSTFSPSYALRVITTEIRSNEKLQASDPLSVLKCIFACLELGLLPGLLGHVYLIPYKDNRNGTTICRLEIGYRGLLDLALRSPNIVSICAELIHEGDEHEIRKGTSPSIHHVARFQTSNILGCYAVAHFSNGGFQFETMSRSQIDHVRSRSMDYSRNSSNSVWTLHYGEMARKTVLKRLCKYLPKTLGISEALEKEVVEDACSRMPQNSHQSNVLVAEMEADRSGENYIHDIPSN